MSSEKLVKTPFKEKLKHELVGRGFVTVCGFFIIILTLAIGIFLIVKGSGSFVTMGHTITEFLFSAKWDPLDVPGKSGGKIGSAVYIVGSLYTCGVALLIATPFALGAAIFISEIAPKAGKVLFRPAVEIFVGIPSVVYGWVGLTILVPLIKKIFHPKMGGYSVLAAAIVLSVMIFPTICTVSADAISSIPQHYRMAAYGLGSTRWQVIWKVVVPAAKNGIFTGIILGLARAFGEALAGYIIIKGLMSYYPGLLSFTDEGIGNQLWNTIYLVFWSLLISCPIGILAGIYMAEYAKEGKLTRFIRICIESLSSLPSIVVGLFGYLVFILMTGMKWNLFAGALAVSIISLPSITTTTEDALRALPKSYKEGSMGLGATHRTTITKVMLPACLPRIVTGIILAAGRGFGEAAALLYTSGQSTRIVWSKLDITSPLNAFNPFRPGETLALHIWVMRTEGALVKNSEKIANFSAAILVIVVLSFSLIARAITARYNRRATGGTK